MACSEWAIGPIGYQGVSAAWERAKVANRLRFRAPEHAHAELISHQRSLRALRASRELLFGPARLRSGGRRDEGRGALFRPLAGPAIPTGRLWLLSGPGRLIVWRHWFFQAFEPWKRRARALSTLSLTLAPEHKSCGVLKSHPAAHNAASHEFGQFWQCPPGPRRIPLPSWIGVRAS
jgi:hypothetical protein